MTYRILTSLQSVHGSHAASYLGALRRAGCSVVNIDPLLRSPAAWGGWVLPSTRLMARASRPLLRRDNDAALQAALDRFQPDLFFTVKGAIVSPRFLQRAQAFGVVTANFFPDVSMTAHGRSLQRALPLYSWLFTSKAYGVSDAHSEFGRTDRCVWVPHGFDPAIHRPIAASPEERARYGADVTFVGTWSPKKQRLLETLWLDLRTSGASLRIWGDQWSGKSAVLESVIEGTGVSGDEYALALSASKISLGLLSEQRPGASSGDQTTTRTFEIPACGSAMVHEDTAELRQFFTPDAECHVFTKGSELVQLVRKLLADDRLREQVASSGLHRCHTSGYSVDARVRTMLDLIGLRSR